MAIINISTDYPDEFQPDKTCAISNLVDGTRDDFDHVVYSLNRIDIGFVKAAFDSAARPTVTRLYDSDALNCWTYEAPSKGLFLKRNMLALAEIIVEDITRKGIIPKLVHGHKLSMEGIIAYQVAKLLNIPFAITVQGNSDRNIVNIRRDLRPLYRRIFHEAGAVFPFTPWALDYLSGVLGKRQGKTQLLPCITAQEQIITPVKTEPVMVSAFHLKNWKLKNIDALLAGASLLEQEIADFRLEILGGGDPEDIEAIMRLIAAAGNPPAHLLGAIDHTEIQSVMNRSALFALLSHRESYGMVFIEALLAGCPVIYPADAAIDGYFDKYPFAMAVPSGDQQEINEVMKDMLRHSDDLKLQLQRWQESGEPAFFQKQHILKNYSKGLKIAMDQQRHA